MKISLRDLQRNWLARYGTQIRGIIYAWMNAQEPKSVKGNPLPLWALVSKTQGEKGEKQLTDMQVVQVAEGCDPDFVRLMYIIGEMNETEHSSKNLKIALKKFMHEHSAPKEALTPNSLEGSTEKLIDNEDEPASDEAYEEGFAYFREKRKIAEKKNLRWYLEYQLQQLKRLKNLAWWGKLAAVLYGLAIGISLAGFMALFIGFSLITQNWALLSVPIFLAWFPFQTNFWISRRAPSELIFDLFTSPRETKPFVWNSLASWRSLCKEYVARFLGLCNASIYGGLTAYGMWEFFTVVGGTATGLGIVFSGLATFALGMMVFLPELGLGIKFNRQQLEKSPTQRYREMCATVGHNPKHVARFWFVFACVLVGAVFTALAAGSITASLLGIDLTLAKLMLGVISMTVVPFYFDKAIKNAVNAHKSEEAKDTLAGNGQTLSLYAKIMRAGNASMNAIPAFLGGMGLIAGPAGIAFALVTGLAGFIASYLSGEDGETRGYENEINKELINTRKALYKITENIGEPEVLVNKQSLKATQCPYLFKPFHTTRETHDAELDLLNVHVPMPLTSPKIETDGKGFMLR